jgi:hypothetical protein
MHIRDLIAIHLNEEESNKFAKWAFGDDYATSAINVDPHLRWNKLHKDLLWLSPSGCPYEDMPKMIKIWKDYGDKKICDNPSE